MIPFIFQPIESSHNMGRGYGTDPLLSLLLVIEDGYLKDRFLIRSDKLRKLLKTLLKKEFPRSKKIKLFSYGKIRGCSRGYLINMWVMSDYPDSSYVF